MRDNDADRKAHEMSSANFGDVSVAGKFPAWTSSSPEDTEALGSALARCLYPGLLVRLSGDLGAGKTFLARAIGANLGALGIKSPTFAIETIFHPSACPYPLVHADLYRLEDERDETAQLEEYLDDGCVVLVEWGERWKNPPPLDRWDVHISLLEGSSSERREIRLASYGMRALEQLSAAYEIILDAAIRGDD